MKSVSSHSVGWLLIFLAVGGILGGILGDFLSHAGMTGIMPILSQHYEIFDIQNFRVNLYIMELQFGLRCAPNLLSLIGILIAIFIFRRMS